MKVKFDEQFVNNYSLILLNWAKGKTENPQQAEELVQNVWVQFFHAVKINQERKIEIHQPENFLWKIAHYVWCSYLSARNSLKNNSVSLDESENLVADKRSDFESKLMEDEQNARLLAYMRKTVMQLNYLQRECLISFYIDGKSQKEIAEKLNISVSAVKWHLFDTRTKLKEEIVTMENTNKPTEEFIYRPKHLHVAINGQWAHELDTNKINESLSKQNICLACYRKPQTIGSLAELLGIPKPYLEDDLRWLVEKEFISKGKKGYSTLFSIENAQSMQDIFGYYVKYRSELSDVIVDELIKAEDKIRSCGFYGNNLPMEKLLWSFIYYLCYGFDLPVEKTEIEFPIRPDGGKYFPLGFERFDDEDVKINIDTTDWAFNGPMSSGLDETGGFWWFGLYNFGCSEIIDITMEQYINENRPLTIMLKDLLTTYDGKEFHYSSAEFDDNQKETLANLIKKGFVRLENQQVFPNFIVFTKKQIEEITPVFNAINEKIKEALIKLEKDLQDYYEKNIPEHLKYLKPMFVRQAFSNLGWLTTVLAFNDKKLYIPESKKDGEFLTLIFIKY